MNFVALGWQRAVPCEMERLYPLRTWEYEEDIIDDLSGDFISFWVNLLNVFLHEFENLPFVCCRYFDGSGNVGPFLR